MKYGMLCCLLMLTILVGSQVAMAGVTDKNFEVGTTRDLIDLCSVAKGDPMAKEAIHFCQGYIVGAFDYHVAQSAGPGGNCLVCLPDPPPDRDKVVAMFVAWARQHPQYMNEKPVETEFRFLIEKWPCVR
jgi:hypothetical protein